MKTICVYKASGNEIESVVIEIVKEINHIESLREDGEELAKVLLTTLPGGTIDTLLGALHRHKSSSLIVPFRTIIEPVG